MDSIKVTLYRLPQFADHYLGQNQSEDRKTGENVQKESLLGARPYLPKGLPESYWDPQVSKSDLPNVYNLKFSKSDPYMKHQTRFR